MGCIISKESKADIYKIVTDIPNDTKSTSSSELDKMMPKTPSSSNAYTPTGRNKKDTTNQDSESITKRSRTGSSFWNFKNKNKCNENMECIHVDPLYVIIPYFNYCGFKRRKELFLEFYHRIKDNPRIRIVLCEATEVGKSFELPTNLPNVFIHIHIYTKDQLWIKENLINIAVRRLPTHWKYMAWLDSDIHFINEDWVEHLIARFEKYDVIQLFSTIVYMGPHNEALKTDKSFGYMYRKSGKQYTQSYRYGFWHPGFAWACTKKAYQDMGGLIDYSILGSGDHHMALGLISKIECSHPKNIHPNYRKLLREFENNVRHLRVGYIDGTILHYWHGDLKLRRYKERWQILTDHQYNPLIDVSKDPMGLYQLTETGKKLDNDMRDYFAGRLEDDTRVMS
jgi:hypothetical protein